VRLPAKGLQTGYGRWEVPTQWTKEKTTILGTHYVKRGKWHGIPYTINADGSKGMTKAGWFIVILAALLLIVVTLVEEFVI
jgi:hypothetical protein